MFKRLFWLVVGAGFGFGVSFWLMRFVKQTAARYTPERVSSDLAGALRGFGQDLREAVAEGRAAMQEREAELRGESEHRLSAVPDWSGDDEDDLDEAPPVRRSALRAATARSGAGDEPTGPTGKLARQLAERLSR